ncbi:MAG: EF-hand domain-containing protein [Kiloniellales bacterium]
MLERLTGAPMVVAALIAFTLGVTAYLNTSTVHRDAERRKVLHRQFLLADRNADGLLGRDEAAADYRREFAGLDFDQNGVLSRDEFIGLRKSWAKYHVTDRWKAIQAGRETLLAAVDRNRDGWVTADEYVGYFLDRGFTTMDTDGDGKVSRSEYMAAMGLR